MEPTWINTLNSDFKYYGHIDDFYSMVVRPSRYPYFVWNERVYKAIDSGTYEDTGFNTDYLKAQWINKTEVESLITEKQVEIVKLNADLHHWKSNHKYAVGVKKKLSEKYGDILLENRLLTQELLDERERSKRERMETPSFLSKLKRIWRQFRYGI